MGSVCIRLSDTQRLFFFTSANWYLSLSFCEIRLLVIRLVHFFLGFCEFFYGSSFDHEWHGTGKLDSRVITSIAKIPVCRDDENNL